MVLAFLRSRQRPFGVRLYLALAFAAVALIAAGLAFLLVTDSSEDAATERAREIALGRTTELADTVGDRPPSAAATIVSDIADPGYSAWVFNDNGRLVTPPLAATGVELFEVGGRGRIVGEAVRGSRPVQELPDSTFLVGAPVFRDGRLDGAVLARAEQPQELQAALEEVGEDRLTAAAVAVAVAILVGLVIARAITSRLHRLADSAARITEGRLDVPLDGTGGRDEIGELGTALETMRSALRETFNALSSERDRLSAIFDAMSDAVMVVGGDGELRFANAAAESLTGPDRRVPGMFVPWLRRAQVRGAAEQDALTVEGRVYSINARRLAAEGAVLAVVRDRTEELRREVAERDFVSNAAHELRNPIAGISGSIEVLRAGAKDDPEALEHFLSRLSEDAERVSRLTESLLTLARMEAVGEGGAAAMDVQLAVEEAAQAVAPPAGIEVSVEVEPGLVARGDSVLTRQVLIGLLTNAFKNTPPPGDVTLRARADGEDSVLIEVSDTGSGIAEEEVNRVFERFYRGSGSLEQEGFGLGLSIAKRMVDVMGGDMGVRSKVGVGSTFWIRLPVATAAATPVA